MTYVVRASVSEDIVKSICFRDVLGNLADDDGELHLVVGEVLFNRLCNLGNKNRCVGTDNRCQGLVKQDGSTM